MSIYLIRRRANETGRWSELTMRTLFACALALFSVASVAAENTSKDQIKDAARKACVAAAVERYGEATAKQKAHRKKIGRTKGYAFRMRVGERGEKINCLADANGETLFFSGSM